MNKNGENTPVTAWVLMTVYRGDDAAALDDALKSILIDQTRKPEGALIVIDGPVGPELDGVLDTYKDKSPCPFTVIPLSENGGLSLALNVGLQAIPEDVTYVIRHDADDISRPYRLAEQIEFMEQRPEVGMASGQVSIFEGTPENPVGSRYLPAGIDLRDYSRWRTPINHSCTIIRASALTPEREDYPDTRLPFEDWWLSLRFSKRGWPIEAIDSVQMDFRGGPAMIERRRGFAYVKKEITFFEQIIDEGLMSRFDAMKNLAVRTPARLIPASLGRFVYKRALHRKSGPDQAAA